MFLVRAEVLGEFLGAGHMTYLMAPLLVVYVFINVPKTPHPTLSTRHPSVALLFVPAVFTQFSGQQLTFIFLLYHINVSPKSSTSKNLPRKDAYTFAIRYMDTDRLWGYF